MPLEKVGLEAILLTDEFEKGRKIYERGLARTNSATKKTADAMSKTGKTMTAGWQSAAGAVGLLASAAVASFSVMETAWTAANEAMEKRGMESSAERIEEAWAGLRFELGSNLIPVVEDLGDAAVTMIGKMGEGITVFGDLLAKTHANIASLQAYSQVMTAAGESEEKFAGSIWAHRYQLGKALTGQEEMVSLQERQKRASEAGAEAYERTMERYAEATKPLVETEEEAARNYEKMASVINATLASIADAQRNHNRKLGDMAGDHFYKQERAWAQYEKQVGKEIVKGQKVASSLEGLADLQELLPLRTRQSQSEDLDR